MFTWLGTLFARIYVGVAHAEAPIFPPLKPTGTPAVPTQTYTGPLDFIKSAVVPLGDNILQSIFLIAGFLAVFYLIYAGVQYITSNGVPDKAKAARGAIINAIIGIIVIVASYAIIRLATGLGGFLNSAAVSNIK